MSVEELQKRIEELEQELEPLRTFKDCCIVQYYGKEHFESEFETLDIDRELTDEDFISISNYIKNDETMYDVIGERLTELIAEWNEENEEETMCGECDTKIEEGRCSGCMYCKCGNPANRNDICSHGVADGRCCICGECRKEIGSDSDEEEEGNKCVYCDRNMKEIDDENKWAIYECGGCEKNFCGECLEKKAETDDDMVTELYGLKNQGYCKCCLDEFSDDEEEEEEENKCSQCPTILDDNCPIFIMKNQFTDEEETVCDGCRHNITWSFGWIDDTEEEIDISDLTKFKVKELKAICKSKGIKGYSKLKKQELFDLLK